MQLVTHNPFEGLDSIVRENHPLARHTWYKIGGPARYFIEPTSEDELAEVLRRCTESNIPIYFLGLGANVLISDEGLNGAVIRLSHETWETTSTTGTQITCPAGTSIQKLVLATARQGLAGLECMAGIPGTVGGAVKMNAGGKFGDFGSHVSSLRLIDTLGQITTHSRDQIAFHYRHADLPAPYVLSATLDLSEDDPEQISKRTKEIWMYKQNSQPLNAKSAGCVFKNPPPELSAGRSAGSLIDQAGLKGTRLGQAEVSTIHANFFVAHPGTTASDITQLIDLVKEKVFDRFGVKLETEVKVWK